MFEKNTKLKNSYGFLEKRQISRYNVDISRFLFQKEMKKRKMFHVKHSGRDRAKKGMV